MSSTKTVDKIDKRFLEEGWIEEKIGKDAKIFLKPVSKSVIQNMPDIDTNRQSGIGYVINWLNSAIKLMAK